MLLGNESLKLWSLNVPYKLIFLPTQWHTVEILCQLKFSQYLCTYEVSSESMKHRKTEVSNCLFNLNEMWKNKKNILMLSDFIYSKQDNVKAFNFRTLRF